MKDRQIANKIIVGDVPNSLMYLSDNFNFVCDAGTYYTKAIHDILMRNTTNRIGCIEYILYLMKEFKFDFDYDNTVEHPDGVERITQIISPPIDEITTNITNNYNEYLYFFEKGLNARYDKG